jgi:hypothetical protein
MLKFTLVSDSVRAITVITLMGTIRTRTIGPIIDPITVRIGTEGIIIIAIIIVTPIITGTNLTGIATTGWFEAFRASLISFSGNSPGDPAA